ncbi:hypothetical protein HOLleu_05894 [Holothuria leucospilota]|uniref:Uncharacterized protein n=1 Tax=Holothuria leucospilota TaxID=206669 RepID=A0A9Q1CLC3_HOLLE|nr:hypothetical protein HOLleu_05894 [Holothuria leucospilota]
MASCCSKEGCRLRASEVVKGTHAKLRKKYREGELIIVPVSSLVSIVEGYVSFLK